MSQYDKFIGRKYDEKVHAELTLLHAGSPPIIQVITMNTIVTADYRTDRYRVVVDDHESKNILSIYNG